MKNQQSGCNHFKLYSFQNQECNDALSEFDQQQWSGFYLSGDNKGSFRGEGGFEFKDELSIVVLHPPILWQDYCKDQTGGVLLLFKRNMLPVSIDFYIKATLQLYPKARGRFALSRESWDEIRTIYNKIDSVLMCDYRFKKDYVSELVLQLAHIILKRLSSLAPGLPQKP